MVMSNGRSWLELFHNFTWEENVKIVRFKECDDEKSSAFAKLIH